MSGSIEALEAIATEAGQRRRIAALRLADAQRRFDQAAEAYSRACGEMGAAIEAADREDDA